MIETAARNLAKVEEFKSDQNRVRVKPFVGDFFGINNMELFYSYRKSPNIFSILGNTIGNSEESDLINTLRGTIEVGDFTIIEFNTNQKLDSIEKLEKTKIYRQHDISPLTSLGLPVKIDELIYTTVQNDKDPKYSVVENTITSIAEYRLDRRKMKRIGVSIKGNIKLSIVHYYNFDSFNDHMQKTLEMETIYSSNEDGVGIVVLYKAE
jgi:hypothetical protein